MTADPRHKIALPTATSIVVANMVGTGVFTSLGFQVLDIETGFALLSLWLVGGVFALCGALSYAELAAALPRSGGEYHFLSRVFHPLLGFLAGWISLTVGFAAPIALAAMAFGSFFNRLLPAASPQWASIVLIVLVTLAHLRNLRLGSMFQNFFTLFKVLLVLAFAAAAWRMGTPTGIDFAPSAAAWREIGGAPFAVSLLFVMYAYAGWNASTYIIGEVRDPARNVPRSLILGTTLVLLLYLALNWAFLHSTPITELQTQSDKVSVGHTVAIRIFGELGGRLMSGLLCIALVSSISSMIWVGPRVTMAMGEDFTLFRRLAQKNRAGIPIWAILLQTMITVVLILTATFDKVLIYTQIALTTSSLLTVVAVFWLRHHEPDLPRPYRTWGYPVTPLLFAAISLMTIVYTARAQPWESLAGLATVLLGIPLYLLSKQRSNCREND